MKALALLQAMRKAYELKELRLHVKKLSITEIDEAIEDVKELLELRAQVMAGLVSNIIHNPHNIRWVKRK